MEDLEARTGHRLHFRWISCKGNKVNMVSPLEGGNREMNKEKRLPVSSPLGHGGRSVLEVTEVVEYGVEVRTDPSKNLHNNNQQSLAALLQLKGCSTELFLFRQSSLSDL